MNTYTVTDPRTGKTITKSFKAVKGAAMFDWAWNNETNEHDIPSVSFFKSIQAAEAGLKYRRTDGVTIIPLEQN